MESTELSGADFWGEDRRHLTVLGNPRRKRDLQNVAEQAGAFPELAGSILVETSGSSGRPRFVCLSRQAMLLSAQAVNEHLRVAAGDRWLCALPTFHVGGLAIHARGYSAEVEVVAYQHEWSASTFCLAIDQANASLTSLVPTQVCDLVAAELGAPKSLRAVVVGGGHLPATLESQATELGWPLLRSYGMTEASSQIATQSLVDIGVVGEQWLPILSHLQVRSSADGRLEISGASLCEFYFDGDIDIGFEAVPAKSPDGWLTTQDRGEVGLGCLRFLGRSDRVVKILGELVDVDQVEKRFRERIAAAASDTIFVEAFDDQRQGARLVPIVMQGSFDPLQVAAAIGEQNQQALPIERLGAAMWIEEVPRTALGKIRHAELRRLARSR